MASSDQPTTPGNAIKSIIDILEPMEESSRERVLTAVQAFFVPKTINSIQSSTNSRIKQPDKVQLLPDEPQATSVFKDIRTLKEEKQPKTDIEMSAVMAFYLSEVAAEQDRKETVTASDVEKYFKQANYRLPKKPDQTLRNAKRAGYFESAGEGQFKLNPVGYNLVSHSLPRSTGKSKPKKTTKKGKTRSGKK